MGLVNGLYARYGALPRHRHQSSPTGIYRACTGLIGFYMASRGLIRLPRGLWLPHGLPARVGLQQRQGEGLQQSP